MYRFIVMVILFSYGAKAQTYVPFISTLDSSDIWMDHFSCWDGSCFTASTKLYNLDGDTTIGINQFTKLMVREEYEQGVVIGDWCPQNISIYDYYIGAIREESKRIYFSPSGASEYMSYDFNLTIGDTVPSPMNLTGNEEMRVIVSIDFVSINGVNRQRYWLTSGTHIVEGIGASTGLFLSTSNYLSCSANMFCYSEYNNIEYYDLNCQLDLNIEEEMTVKTPDLVKIVDIMGNETEYQPNMVLIYMFSDGTTKKIYTIE